MVVEGQPLCDPEPPPGRDSSPSRLSGVSGLPPQDVDAIEARASRERARRLARAQAQRGDVAEPAARRRLAADGRRGGGAGGGGVAAQAAALQETLAAMRTQMHVLGERLDALQSAALPVGAERPASAPAAYWASRSFGARPAARRATAPHARVAGEVLAAAAASDGPIDPGAKTRERRPTIASIYHGHRCGWDTSEDAQRLEQLLKGPQRGSDGAQAANFFAALDARTIVRSRSRAKVAWDVLLVFVAAHEAFAAPLLWAFGDRTTYALTPFWPSEILAYAVLVGDIPVSTRTTYFVGEREVLDPRTLAARYVYSPACVLDVIACAPVWVFEDRSPRLLRLLCMSKLVTKLQTTFVDASAAFRLAQLVVLLLYAIHWSACCWVVIMSEPFKAQFGFYECAGSSADFCESCESPGWDARACFDCCDKDPIGMRDAYARSMVHATSLLFALGTFMPEAFGEQVFFVCIIVLGGLLSASIFGAFAVVVGEVFAGENNVQARISATSTQMARMHIPRPMRKRVHDYQRHMAKLEESGATVFTKDSFMSDLSPALRGDLKLYLFLETIAQNVFFLKANPSQQLLGMIVEGLYTAVYMPGDLIMRKGDPSDWMGFIGTGGEETLSLINSIKSDVELKKRLSIEEIAALKKDTIVADIRKKMLASVVQDQSYAAESKRQKRASGHAGKRGDESKEPTTDPVPARSLDEKTVADLAADAAAAFD
ncbi:voltage-gated potassium channel [Aureococcus anophagefferens]|nr:voltage-gated potassium channel [Aureococcus anophagefferens]